MKTALEQIDEAVAPHGQYVPVELARRLIAAQAETIAMFGLDSAKGDTHTLELLRNAVEDRDNLLALWRKSEADNQRMRNVRMK
jgi:hypothetical protein